MRYRESKLYTVVGDDLVDEGKTVMIPIPESDEDLKVIEKMARDGQFTQTPESFHDPIYTGEDSAESEDFPDED